MSETLRLKSPCGSVFEITADAIWSDFRALLKAQHDIDDAEADSMLARRKAEEPEFWMQWFREQFDWQDIDRLGTVISRPSGEQLKQICDAYRNSDQSPITFYIDHAGQ